MITLDLIILISINLFILFLGFLVFIHNSKNINNRLYLVISIITVIWSTVNHLSLIPGVFMGNLFWARLVLFFAVLHTLSLFLFIFQFPEEKVIIFRSKKNFYFVLFAISVAFLALSPAYFKEIAYENNNIKVTTGKLIFILPIYFVFIILRFIFTGFKKSSESKDKTEKNRNIIMFGSVSITYLLLFFTQFIMTNFLKSTVLLPYGPLFILPLIIGTGYAIVRYQAMNVKIISTEIFVFLLLVLSILQVIMSKSYTEVISNIIILALYLFLGILLIRSVYAEVEQREKLEQLNRIKSEFLSFASHQVRAPMAVVKGYAELIETQIENIPPQAKDFAHKIRESVNKLLELVEEFMDYRRIEEGKMELHFEEVDFVSLIKEMVNNFNLIAKEKNLELNFETSMEQCLVKVDKMRFSQVIQNLIDNAIKYTSQGWVKVSLQKEDKSVLITVADSGIGMSKELQQKLFGEFVRDPSIKKEIRGTGLGLYIAKYIVEAHQGKIWAESEGEGKGSKFYVRLPLN